MLRSTAHSRNPVGRKLKEGLLPSVGVFDNQTLAYRCRVNGSAPPRLADFQLDDSGLIGYYPGQNQSSSRLPLRVGC